MRHLLALLLTINLASLGFQGKKRFLTDDLGDPFYLARPPQRIVSLAPNITEILFELGLEDRLVGVTRYCDYPSQAAKKEIIGGLVDPNLEKIEALKPDLIVAFRGNPLRILKKLKNLRFPVFVFETGTTLEDLFPMVEKLGRLTHQEEEAVALVQALEKKHQDIQDALEDVEEKPKVFLSLHGAALWTCGKGSFLNDLLVSAKAVNIAGEVPQKWLNLNREQLIHKDPEVIIILAKNMNAFTLARERLTTDSRLREISAIKENRIFFVDENETSRFGPRLLDALEDVARILHPRQFGRQD